MTTTLITPIVTSSPPTVTITHILLSIYLSDSSLNFPHIVINLLQLLNPTKYAVFVTDNHNWQIVCLPNKLAILRISSAQYPVRARAAVVYFTAQSCLHMIINYLQPHETDQNMRYLSPYHWQVLNSTKFCWKRMNSVARFKILHSAENCGP